MSLKQNGKLLPWKTFQARTFRVNQGINKHLTALKMIPKLRLDVLERADGDENKILSICALGPKRLWKMGMLDSIGWRRGFTK